MSDIGDDLRKLLVLALVFGLPLIPGILMWKLLQPYDFWTNSCCLCMAAIAYVGGLWGEFAIIEVA